MKNRIASATVVLAILAASAAPADQARTGIYPEGNIPIAPYTPGIKTDNGFLYVAGQIPYVKGALPAHAADGENDIQDQSKIVMENLKAVLDEAGYSFNDAVRTTVYLSDISLYGGFNEVYATYWNEGDMPPSRAAIAVNALPGGKPGAPILVEVSMVAYKSN
ncbi:endoribonuclease L-PSP [Tateyamaria omphalii]|uniref:RidA family protein n=1 Tax=Tateyamaria omphalii TaxID=299262 RepID=UPI001678BACA|nr:RidA family protein [Tateyamaria omphalii]GGX71131.1 endoribonuclease L-PSP [Tateyamaria omphalii]